MVLLLAKLLIGFLWTQVLITAQTSATRPALTFQKVFGGSGVDVATAIAVDRFGNSYVAGTTTSPDFPVQNAFQPHLGGATGRTSLDQGKSWQPLSVPFPIYSVAISAKRPNVIFAGTTKGLYQSKDNGGSWQRMPAIPADVVEALIADPTDPDRIYAATVKGLFQSSDGGTAWKSVDLGVPQVIVLASSLSQPSTLYAATDSDYGSAFFTIAGKIRKAAINSTPSNVYRTVDQGRTWSLLPNAPAGVFSIACDPANAETVFAAAAENGFTRGGATAIYKTTDAGITWSKTANLPITNSTFTLAVGSGTVYLGTPTGVLISRDGGAKWTITSITTEAGNIAIDAANPAIVYAYADRLYRSSDAGLTWAVVLNVRQTVETIVVVPTVPARVFVGSEQGQNVFLTKWSADGSQMIYSTYLGGSSEDQPTAIAIDAQGNVFVTGHASSLDFPTTAAALQKDNKGSVNAFLAKVSPAGDQLLYSTYIGGTGEDSTRAIALDSAGGVYLTGYAGSADFPVAKPAVKAPAFPGCIVPASLSLAVFGKPFAMKINTNAGQIDYASSINVGCGGEGLGIAVDQSGAAVVAGVASRSACLQCSATDQNFSGFLIKIDSRGQVAPIASAQFSKASSEAVALDAAGNLLVTGSNFGPELCFDEGMAASLPYCIFGEPYIQKLTPDGSVLADATLSSSSGAGKSIAIAPDGRTWVAGTTQNGKPFPWVHPFQAAFGYGFVAQLSSDLSKVFFSTNTDGPDALALSVTGAAYLADKDLNSERARLSRIDPDIPARVTIEAPERQDKLKQPKYFEVITPGEVVVLAGTGLGPAQEAVAPIPLSGPFPLTLAGTSATFDNLPAQLLSVKEDRVVCVVPFGINAAFYSDLKLSSTAGQAKLRIGSSNTSVTLTRVVNAAGDLNSPGLPATIGSIVTLYGSGFGQTDPPTLDGIEPAALPRVFIEGPLQVDFDGEPAQATYAGAAPLQLSGVTQFNIRVPAQLRSGEYTLTIGLAGGPDGFASVQVYVAAP